MFLVELYAWCSARAEISMTLVHNWQSGLTQYSCTVQYSMQLACKHAADGLYSQASSVLKDGYI